MRWRESFIWSFCVWRCRCCHCRYSLLVALIACDMYHLTLYIEIHYDDVVPLVNGFSQWINNMVICVYGVFSPPSPPSGHRFARNNNNNHSHYRNNAIAMNLSYARWRVFGWFQNSFAFRLWANECDNKFAFNCFVLLTFCLRARVFASSKPTFLPCSQRESGEILRMIHPIHKA